MIVELSVRNLAIIEHAHVELSTGFTVFTGETGAGKSLLVDAIQLVLGQRAGADMVREGADRASVEVRFDPALAITREVLAQGRSVGRINGQAAAVGDLRALGKTLVDLHGQHDSHGLLDPVRHLELLDEWIGDPARTLLAETAAAHERSGQARRRLAMAESSRRDREQRLDLLRFQVSEIEGVDPRVGEVEELELRFARLRNVERLRTTVGGALEALADGEGAALDVLSQAARDLEGLTPFDAGVEPLAQQLREAVILSQEATHKMRAYLEDLDMDPAELETVADRLDQLRKLRRKYGESEEDVLAFLSAAQEELDLLEGSDASEESLRAAVAEADAVFRKVAEELSHLRKDRAPRFGEDVQLQLRDLAMDRARFEVRLSDKLAESNGVDAAEYFFSANPGEPPRSLARIASGGELSRVMLGIKTTMAGRVGVPTLIFDEVDAGLGGRAAATVARKLRALSHHAQVIVISHLPQIAAQADVHFHIDKREVGGRVRTSLGRLDDQGRVAEIARMLAGDRVTESALANAREMLNDRSA